MQQTQNDQTSANQSKPNKNPGATLPQQADDYLPGQAGPALSAADEARQLLDEIAGLSSPRPRPRRLNPGAQVAGRWKVFWHFISGGFGRTDFRLLRELRIFLKSPGNFFWFNRIAPERAAEHFGTSSTDAMTHHARRYGAHTAMLVLAVLVVLFGGFSGLASPQLSPFTTVKNPQMVGNDLMIIGDTREIYASAVAANDKTIQRRIPTLTVKQGETLRAIAADHNISLDTLLYANNIVDPDAPLQAGQALAVPPATGMLHITQPGDTVGKLANLYGVDPQVILDYPFNRLQNSDPSDTLKPLQEIMVPGGQLPLRNKLYMYTVRNGDTLKSVAERFGLKPQTLLDNNDLDGGLQVGQQIRILPVDGVIYSVKPGDTLDGIASYLSTSPENIINFTPNNVARGVPLTTGASLIIPAGSWPPPPPPVVDEPVVVPVKPKPAVSAPAVKQDPKKPAPAVAPLPTQPAKSAAKPAASSAAKPAAPAAKPAAPAKSQISVGSAPAPSAPGAGIAHGSMIWPMRGIIMTYFGERIWYGIHMGLDISTSCGTPVVAADGGTVIEAGWNPYGYGIDAVIDHGNGLRTRYAHFSSVNVGVGQRVAQGQLVGHEGTTGNSTGCHLHFEVIAGGHPVNPLGYLR